jgi:hypothetical protein
MIGCADIPAPNGDPDDASPRIDWRHLLRHAPRRFRSVQMTSAAKVLSAPSISICAPLLSLSRSGPLVAWILPTSATNWCLRILLEQQFLSRHEQHRLLPIGAPFNLGGIILGTDSLLHGNVLSMLLAGTPMISDGIGRAAIYSCDRFLLLLKEQRAR